MRMILLALAILLSSAPSWARNYPFSVVKSGIGKQAVIFIPGFACSGDVWNETVATLKESNTCYILTMAGFAGAAPEEHPSFESWKNKIAQFIQDEKIDKPILVGHSMGGGLVLALASDFPELIKKIVVVDALPCLMALNNPGFQSIPNKDYSGFVNQMLAMDEEQFNRMLKMSAASLTTDSLKFSTIADWSLASDRKTYGLMYYDFANTDLRERLKNITVPSLILLEPQFKNIEPVIKEQYKHLPDAELRYATKGLHFLMYDDKEWFMNQVSEFIKK